MASARGKKPPRFRWDVSVLVPEAVSKNYSLRQISPRLRAYFLKNKHQSLSFFVTNIRLVTITKHLSIFELNEDISKGKSNSSSKV